GMTFGPEHSGLCMSRFTTPFSALAPTTSPLLHSGETPTPVFEVTSRIGSTLSATSSITVIPSGLAIADPITVAWQYDDLALFPTEYARSLAQKIGITLPTPRSQETTSPPNTTGVSTAAKVGIGIGAVLGAAILGVVIVVLFMRRRWRKAEITSTESNLAEMEDQDGDHGVRKWFFGGRWRGEISAIPTQNELDSKTVHVVPGPPAELEATV
ncbi:hypothetical protein BKA63DRAFT_389829, partial [Paraphoma chrysanthemicola]